MQQEGEPSVEEILESIKQVIARDNRDIAEAQRLRRNEASAAPAEEMHVTEEAEEVLDLSEAAEVIASDECEIEDEGVDTSPLLDQHAEHSMRDSLAALAMLAEPGQKPQIVRTGETSLEGLAREMMRPMLKEWLDENLPDLVEKLVSQEIARIAGKNG